MTTLHYVVLESNNSSQLLRILTAKLQGCVFVGDGVDAGRVDGVDGVDSQEIIYSRIKIQYYRIALPCKRVRRRQGK